MRAPTWTFAETLCKDPEAKKKPARGGTFHFYRFALESKHLGVWPRSLRRLHGVQEIGGANPPTPISKRPLYLEVFLPVLMQLVQTFMRLPPIVLVCRFKLNLRLVLIME